MNNLESGDVKIVFKREDTLLLEKTNPKANWFNHNCSNDNLKKELNLGNVEITRVQFLDGIYIGSDLMIYFKNN